MKEQLTKLRAVVETQAEMCLGLIDKALVELEDEETKCPECGEQERLEDTTPMGANGKGRVTCLSCGTSFEEEMEEEEVS